MFTIFHFFITSNRTYMVGWCGSFLYLRTMEWPILFLPTTPKDCLWNDKVGATHFCYKGEEPSGFTKGFNEFEEKATFLWEINEVSDKEHETLLKKVWDAKQRFQIFMSTTKTPCENEGRLLLKFKLLL